MTSTSTGKRVAVIGSGASSYQTTPELAKIAGHVHLFQRTPSWCFENPMYVTPLPEQSVWLDLNFPYYVNFARFRLSWLYGPQNVGASSRGRSRLRAIPMPRSAANKASRDARVAYINKKLAGRPDLIEKMIPPAPPMSSRPIMIDTEDSIFEALLRDNVTLVTDGIERITPAGIVSAGKEIPVDVIVYATGFKANDFLWPMEIRGRDGVRVEDLWAKDGARAYIGSMLPGFPELLHGLRPEHQQFRRLPDHRPAGNRDPLRAALHRRPDRTQTSARSTSGRRLLAVQRRTRPQRKAHDLHGSAGEELLPQRAWPLRRQRPGRLPADVELAARSAPAGAESRSTPASSPISAKTWW